MMINYYEEYKFREWLTEVSHAWYRREVKRKVLLKEVLFETGFGVSSFIGRGHI